MARDVARDWMWSEACEMLARAERMHRELFRPAARRRGSRPGSRRSIFWRPNIEVLALVALPGVDADNAQAVIEDGDLVIAGTRVLPRAVAHGRHPSARTAARPILPAGAAAGRAAIATCAVPLSPDVW